jgi:hypothetical protein
MVFGSETLQDEDWNGMTVPEIEISTGSSGHVEWKVNGEDNIRDESREGVGDVASARGRNWWGKDAEH